MKSLKALSREELKSLAPSIFNHTVGSKLTDKYVHIPTDTIVEDMEALGWFPYDVKTVKTRKKNANTAKHLIQFFNPDIVINDENGEADMHPTLLLVNSHDGSTAVKFEMGVFRFVCSNGLVGFDQHAETERIKHIADNASNLDSFVISMNSKVNKLLTEVNEMKHKGLSIEDMRKLAIEAARLRYNNLDEINIDDLFAVNRVEDESNDLWTVFNRIQENLTHDVTNMNEDIKLNQQLFSLVESFA